MPYNEVYYQPPHMMGNHPMGHRYWVRHPDHPYSNDSQACFYEYLRELVPVSTVHGLGTMWSLPIHRDTVSRRRSDIGEWCRFDLGKHEKAQSLKHSVDRMAGILKVDVLPFVSFRAICLHEYPVPLEEPPPSRRPTRFSLMEGDSSEDV